MAKDKKQQQKKNKDDKRNTGMTNSVENKGGLSKDNYPNHNPENAR